MPRRQPIVMPKTRPWKLENLLKFALTSLSSSSHEVWRASRRFHLQLHRRQRRRSHSDDLDEALNVNSRADAQNIGNCVAKSSSCHRGNRHDESQAVLDVIAGDDHRKVIQEAEANEWQWIDKTHWGRKLVRWKRQRIASRLHFIRSLDFGGGVAAAVTRRKRREREKRTKSVRLRVVCTANFFARKSRSPQHVTNVIRQ